MSYQTMDHAGWVERNGAAAKRQEPKKRKDNTRGWHAMPEQLTEFQTKVMDILGMTFGGIYNAPIAWSGVQWQCGHGIEVPVRANGLSTWDYSNLTRLVFLCHEARIRCDIDAHSFRHLKLMFHPRSHEGGMGSRHPNLDEAVQAFREYLPKDHRIIYRKASSAEAA